MIGARGILSILALAVFCVTSCGSEPAGSDSSDLSEAQLADCMECATAALACRANAGGAQAGSGAATDQNECESAFRSCRAAKRLGPLCSLHEILCQRCLNDASLCHVEAAADASAGKDTAGAAATECDSVLVACIEEQGVTGPCSLARAQCDGCTADAFACHASTSSGDGAGGATAGSGSCVSGFAACVADTPAVDVCALTDGLCKRCVIESSACFMENENNVAICLPAFDACRVAQGVTVSCNFCEACVLLLVTCTEAGQTEEACSPVFDACVADSGMSDDDCRLPAAD